jgi:hypothetical protein
MTDKKFFKKINLKKNMRKTIAIKKQKQKII